MLRIGRSYITRKEGASRLCADLTVGDRRTTLWFGVDGNLEDCLALGRSDAFVMALLPGTMRGGHEIVCEDPMSERLHCQLTNGLIPALAFAGELYHVIKISAPLTAERLPNRDAVGTGFSGGVDSLYTIMCHGAGSELPLTHLVVFNTGNIQDRAVLLDIFRQAEAFGVEYGLRAAFVDTNFADTLFDRYNDVYTFRNLACALAMQGLFSCYLLSSGPDASRLELSLRVCDRYDLLTINCASTDSMTLYLSGAETTRNQKLAALTQWPPSRRLLHPCTGTAKRPYNCSHCKKCICDMTILYGLGMLEAYQAVFDTADYLRHLPERIGFVLAFSDSSRGCRQAVRLLKERNVPIPPAAYIYAEQFRRAAGKLKAGQKGSEAI